MELMDATWRTLFLLCNNGSCFFCLYPLTKTKLILIYLQHMLLHKRDFHQNIHAV